ncbi:MAG: hypothetical protein ACHQF2_10895, partial [Flavobacteriales bacterium]
MKKTLFLIIFPVVFYTSGNAQTVAQDWTKTDCSGNPHSLFADYLNNYKVVLMEFGMACSTCGLAGQYFQQLRDQYAISNPGEFYYFYMDYWAPNDCAPEISTFLTTYSLTPDVTIDHCLPEMTYYMSGSPMPGYVIVAGPYYAVYM